MNAVTASLRITPRVGVRWGSMKPVERSILAYRRGWMVIVSGFFEPLFYLLSVGVGLGHLIGKVPGPGGELISYRSFIAPALLATSAYNGAVYDSTMNVFWKMRWGKIYDAMLATPLTVRDVAVGETIWALLRGLIYSVAFVIVMLGMGLVHSWWVIGVIPACSVIGFGFAGLGMAVTSHIKSWEQFDMVAAGQMVLFLLSATFSPLSSFPNWAQPVIRCSPLYQSIELVRSLTLGGLGGSDLLRIAYLLLMGSIGLWIATRKMGRLLTP